VKINFNIVAIAASMLLTAGCVSKTQFDSLQGNYNKLQTTNSELATDGAQCKDDLNRANAKIASMQDQITSQQQRLTDLQTTLDKCITSTGQGNASISKLVDELGSSNKYIQELAASKTRSDSMNLAMTKNLTESLTGQELHNVIVKVQQGMVHISVADTMLYQSGTYNISPEAGDVLAKISKIINDNKGFDILVVGNTDSIAVAIPNIRNNWDMSTLKASSAVQALQNTYGVDPQRLTAGGRSEYNPVAGNNTPRGRSLNKRTEIIITPRVNQVMDLIEKAPPSDSTKMP
jgi:chemotaxis protein MotB